MKLPRRGLLWAGGVLAALVLGVALGEGAGWPFLRTPLQDALARATGAPVRLEGRFRTRLLWRLQLEVEHLNIGAPAGFGVPHLVDARDVDLAWRWSELLAWRRGAPLRLERLSATTLDAHLVRRADGQARLALRDGTLSHLATEALGLDLAQALGVMVRGDRPLPLRCARLQLVIRDGIVKPGVAVIDNADTTLRIDGQVNLRDETLALRAQAKPKDFSPLALRTPILVGGTLGAPAVGIEGKRLAGKALGALALGAVQGPLAALLPFVDTGGDAATVPCADGGGTAPAAAASAGARSRR